MILSACYGFVRFLLGVVAYCAVYRTIHQRLLLASAVFFVGRCVLYLGNFVLEIFPPKFANDWGLFWVEYHFLGNQSVPTADSFAVQGLLIAPIYGFLSDPILAAYALAGLEAAITRNADDNGWYNAPKQLCRGGDLRALTFCCMPVKRCP